MKDTLFWNPDDKASISFVQRLQKSPVIELVKFNSFKVYNPKQQDAGVNKLLQILQVDTLPTIFFQGQAFCGSAAFEWLEYQIESLQAARGPVGHRSPEPSVEPREPSPEPAGFLAAHSGSENFVSFNSQPSSVDAPPSFNIDVGRGNMRGNISDDALRAAQEAREQQVPVKVSRV